MVDGVYKDYQSNFVSLLNQKETIGIAIVRPFYNGQYFNGGTSTPETPATNALGMPILE